MTGRLSTAELARQLGLSRHRAVRVAQRYAWLSHPKGDPPTYDPMFTARYRAMRGLPHSVTEPAHRDWFALHLGAHLMSEPVSRRRRVVSEVNVPGVPGGVDPNSQVNPAADLIDDAGDPESELLIYPGELLTQGTTLAITLPGDTKESYFTAKHVAIVQEGEDAEEVVLRSLAVINNAVAANVEDNLQRWAPPPTE